MLQVVAELSIEEDDQHLHELRVVDQMGGPQQLLPQLTQFQPADTPERLEAFLARLRAYPAFMAANAEILRDGLASGLTAPRIVAERTIAQIERMLAVPIDDGHRPVDGQGRQRRGPRARPRRRPGRRLPGRPARSSRRSRGDYLAATREEPGLWSAPERRRSSTGPRSGAGRRSTSTPQEVHEIGLDELESIEEERREIARAAGLRRRHRRLPGGPRRRPRQHPADQGRARRPGDRGHRARDGRRAALLRASCRGPAARSAPVEEYKEKDAPFAYYYPPAPDGSRPGIYYANGYDLPSRKYTKLATTTYHEAAPGHHFQITLEMENPHLNRFRRLGARMVGGAYVEGWGLYSERLADEMGLFRDEGERFGMLDAQAWRAARLVVDTGLHALRWPRQRSIDFAAGGRPVRDRRGHRDRPLHLLAGPGADLQDRPARDRAAAGASSRRATARASTCGRSTTRSSATARCRSRRSRASSRTGSRRRRSANGTTTGRAYTRRSRARPGRDVGDDLVAR